MAKDKPVFDHRFEAGEAMSVPFNMPGGRNFLLRIMAWGTALVLLVYALFGRSFFGAYKEILITSLEMDETNPDPEVIAELMGQLGGIMGPALLLGLFAWVVFVMVETAMHKNIFRGTDNGLLPLRFGRDEARVMLAQFVLAICMTGVYFLTILAIMLLFVLAGGLGSVSSVLGVFAGIGAFFGMIFLLGFLVHVCMRWAPAAAMSVRDNKQRIFEGWAITKGRGWPLFGSYFVVFLIGYIAIYIIMFLGAFLAFGDMQVIAAFSGLQVEDSNALFERLGNIMKQPKVMITLVIFTILYVLTLMVWYMCFWGVGNYAAQLDARENGNMPAN